MRKQRVVLVSILLIGFCVELVFAAQPESPAPRRAQLPHWDKQDESLFFADAFKTLRGTRPLFSHQPAPKSPGSDMGKVSRKSTPWDDSITASVIEAEVKLIHRQIRDSVSKRSEFLAQGFRTSRSGYALLAVLFGVINEYEGTVRWREYAPTARDIFAQCAQPHKDLKQQFRVAKQRLADLDDLIRGQGIPTSPHTVSQNSWGDLDFRRLVMQRIQVGMEQLEASTRDKKEMQRETDVSQHQAQIISLLATVMSLPSMSDVENEDYALFCFQLARAARETDKALEKQDSPQVQRSIREARKRCTECHDQYRG